MANKDNNAKDKLKHSNPPMQYQPINTGMTNTLGNITDVPLENSIVDSASKAKSKAHKNGKNNMK